MTQPAPTAETTEDGVAAETVLAKVVQSGELGRALVERAYYAALSEKRTEQVTALTAQLAELRETNAPEQKSD